MQQLQIGAYWKADLNFPGHTNYCIVLPTSTRIISSAVTSEEPPREVATGCWFRDKGDGQVKTRLRPTAKWRIDRYYFDGWDLLWQNAGLQQARWTAMNWNELPDSFRSLAAKTHKRMNRLQQDANTG